MLYLNGQVDHKYEEMVDQEGEQEGDFVVSYGCPECVDDEVNHSNFCKNHRLQNRDTWWQKKYSSLQRHK